MVSSLNSIYFKCITYTIYPKLSGGYLYIDTICYTHGMLSFRECPRDAVRAHFWRDRDMHTSRDTGHSTK